MKAFTPSKYKSNPMNETQEYDQNNFARILFSVIGIKERERGKIATRKIKLLNLGFLK